jgi:septin family protein
LEELNRRWDEAKCDIAILGVSGCGKSTFINNLLDVPPKNSEELYVYSLFTSTQLFIPLSSRTCVDFMLVCKLKLKLNCVITKISLLAITPMRQQTP